MEKPRIMTNGCWASTFAVVADQPVNATDVLSMTPFSLELPGEPAVRVKNWRDVTVKTLTWLAQRGYELPLPHNGGETTGRSFFLNTPPICPDRRGFKAGRGLVEVIDLQLNGRTVYVHVKRGAGELIHNLAAVITDVGANPSQFIVHFRSR